MQLKFLSSIDQTYHLGIMSREVYLSIWIVIFIMLGFYLLGKIKFAHDSDLPHVSVPRLVLAMAAFSFAIYMVPGIFGANLSSISALIPPKSSQDFDLTSAKGSPISTIQDHTTSGTGGMVNAKYSDFLHLPYGLNGFFDYEEGMAYARENNLPVLLDFKGSDRLLAVTTLSFDIAVLELFLPLSIQALTFLASSKNTRVFNQMSPSAQR